MAQVQLTKDARRVLSELDDKLERRRVLGVVAATMDTQNHLTVGHIKAERLTGKGPFPVSQHRLGVVTNRLRPSIRASKARVRGLTVVSAIGSNVEYFGPHEFGFEGDVRVESHRRKVPRSDEFQVGNVAVKRYVLKGVGIDPSARRGRRRLLQISSGVTFVKAHTRRLSIPARAPVGTGIEDRLGKYAEALSNAIVESVTGDGGPSLS